MPRLFYIEFLDNNKNFSGAHGKGIIVTSSENPNKIDDIDLYHQAIRLESSAKERMYQHLSNNLQTNFSVYRTKIFRIITKL